MKYPNILAAVDKDHQTGKTTKIWAFCTNMNKGGSCSKFKPK